MTITDDPEPSPSYEALLKEYGAHLRAVEGKAKRTSRDYVHDARGLLRFLERDYPGISLAEVTPTHLAGYLVDQEDRGRSAVTRRRSIYALRSLLRFAVPMPDGKTAAHAVGLPKQPPSKTSVFTTAEVKQILTYGAAQTSLRGQLAYAIVATAAYAGLRCSELASLRIADVDLDDRRLEVVGKGDKQRRVPIPRPLVTVLEHYLTQVRPQLPGETALFANPNSMPDGPHYGSISIWVLPRLGSQLCRDAGLTGKTNVHKLRHYYATEVLRSCGDLHRVQRLLGHSSIQTTLRYTHLLDEDLRDAVDGAFNDGD